MWDVNSCVLKMPVLGPFAGGSKETNLELFKVEEVATQ